MTALLSLPRLCADALAQTLASAMPVRLGISPATRAAAARQLQRAVLSRRTTPRAARAAMRRGDVGVSLALREASATPARPRFSGATLQNIPRSLALPRTHFDALVALARELASDGDLAEDQLRSVAAAPSSATFLMALCVAWDRRCARIAAEVVPFAYDEVSVTYGVSPVAILNAVDAVGDHDYGTMAAFEERLEGGVVTELVHWPFALLPAHPQRDPDFYRAFVGAWSAIADVTRSPFLVPFDPSLMDIGGFVAEMMNDAIDTARYEKGRLVVSPDQLRLLEQELGPGDDWYDTIAEFAAWKRAASVSGWAPHTKPARAWIRRATPRQRTLILNLWKIYDRHRECVKKSRALKIQSTWAGSEPIAMFLLPSDCGMDEQLAGWTNSMYQSGEDPLWQCTPENEKDRNNPRAVLAVADHVIRIAAAATAAKTEVSRYASP